MPLLARAYAEAGMSIPDALVDWEDRVAEWYDEYSAIAAGAIISEIKLGTAVFAFDHTSERVVLVYAVSVRQLTDRDATRIRGFPDVNASVRAALGAGAFTVDKGHFLGTPVAEFSTSTCFRIAAN
jgi:hypothetical protein